MNVTDLSVIIFKAYMRAKENDDIILAINELKKESKKLYNDIIKQTHQLYVLETSKLLALIPESCSWLYDMYSLPDKFSGEAETNLYRSSTDLMGYAIYKHSMPESIWRFCVCFGCWLKYNIFLRHHVNQNEQLVVFKHSLETSIYYTKNFFPHLLTDEEMIKIDMITEREMYKKYEYDVQTILIQTAQDELINIIKTRLGI